MTGKKTSEENELFAADMDGTEQVRIIKSGSNWRTKFSSLATWLQTQLSTVLQLYKENASSPATPSATGNNAVAVGTGASATGNEAIAIGSGARASGNQAVAAGGGALAGGANSFAEGGGSATGDNSHAQNDNTIAAAYDDTAIGRFNIGTGNAGTWIDTDPLFEIGNGADSDHLHNALTVYKNGVMNINGSYSLPNVDGAANQVLSTDGAGNVTWEDAATTSVFTVSTTDETAATIATFSCATGQVMKVQADIVGACTGGSSGTAGNGMAVNLQFALRNISGTAEIIFSTADIFPDSTFSWAGYTFGAPSGNDVAVNVVGASSTNINWKLITYQQSVVS